MSELKTDECSLFKWAAHEAGHAVAAIVEARKLGVDSPVVLLRLDKTGAGSLANSKGEFINDCRGICDLSDAWMAALKVSVPTSAECRRVMAHAESHCTSLLAGSYAELTAVGADDQFAHAQNRYIRGHWNDLQCVDTLSRAMAQLPGAAFRRPWMKVHQDARALVINYWPVIESIATRLFQQGEMSGSEVNEEFDFLHPSEDVDLAA